MEFQQPRPQKQMYPLDPPVPCSSCGNPIKQVPFEPDPSRFNRLVCFDCYKARQTSFGR